MIKTVKTDEEFSSKLSLPSLLYQKSSHFFTKMSFYPSNVRYALTISQEKKFIFFRVAKVGTRTILHLFKNANVELTAAHPYDCHYPVNKYKEYFKFAFVRNPWDRLVSCWLNKVVRSNLYHFSAEMLPRMQEFENFVDYVVENMDLECGDLHLRFQSKLIDFNHIDYLGRFENFTADLEEVLDILGIEGVIEKKGASPGRKGYREYYTDSTKDKVYKLYKRDIKIFNYEF